MCSPKHEQHPSQQKDQEKDQAKESVDVSEAVALTFGRCTQNWVALCRCTQNWVAQMRPELDGQVVP